MESHRILIIRKYLCLYILFGEWNGCMVSYQMKCMFELDGALADLIYAIELLEEIVDLLRDGLWFHFYKTQIFNKLSSYYREINQIYLYNFAMQDPQLPDHLLRYIQQSTHEIFNKNYHSKFRKQTTTPHTIISSFCLLTTQQQSLSVHDIQIISIGFGTKSLPYQIVKKYQGFVIKDMHAQQLAKEGMRKFIIQNIPNTSQSNKYFAWDSKRLKHYLKNQYRVILFSSEIFCGDCFVDKQSTMFSGAKPLQFFNTQPIPSEKYKQNCLRTKPGRLDLPISKRSLSLSCSDKIGLWNILGIQGKRLFKKVRPIYISHIIIETKKQLKNYQRVNSGINLLERVIQLKGLKTTQNELMKQMCYLINKKTHKKLKITKQFSLNKPTVSIVKNQTVENEKVLDLCGIIYNGTVEWLNGKTGLPQGVNITKCNPKSMSQFCTKGLFDDEGDQHFEETQEIFKYMALKNRIKQIFGIWTNSFKTKE